MTFIHKEWQNAVHSTAQTGDVVQATTDVTITLSQATFSIRFHCKDNPYLGFNRYNQDNEPLYNQEVFELFISGGTEVSDHYLELEVNPNGALWAGLIQNPGLGLEGQPLKTDFLLRSTHRIHTEVWTSTDEWGGVLSFPADLVPGYPASTFRFNVYRIVAKTQPTDLDWVCSPSNAHFLCLFPTLSGEQPAFHRPLAFGHLD